jgi:hypothetical protein
MFLALKLLMFDKAWTLQLNVHARAFYLGYSVTR